VSVFGSEGITDDRGVLAISIGNGDILKADKPDVILIEGQPVTSPDLASLHQRVKAEDTAKASARDALHLNAEEVGNGKCAQERIDATSGVLAKVSESLKSDPSLGLVTSALVVATPGGAKVDLGTLAAGQYHVFAYGFSTLSLEVATTSGVVSRKDSPLQSKLGALTSLKSSSRVSTLNSGDSLTTRVVGFGCALVVAIKQN
jgi:hypothetical protein